MRFTLVPFLLSSFLLACGGDSACDELKDVCSSCSDPTARMICEAHAAGGNEDICEIDLEPGGFAESCLEQL